MMIGHAAAVVAVLLWQPAGGPPRPCVTPEQAGAGAAVLLPEMVEAVRRGCERHLPETAFLRAEGSELVGRWRAESAPHRRTAHAGLMRMIPPEVMAAMAQGMAGQTGGSRPGTGSPPPREGQPPAAGAPPGDPAAMMRGMMGGLDAAMAERLNPETCKEASRFIEALAPLPAGNVARLVSAAMGLGVALAPPKGDDGPPICPR